MVQNINFKIKKEGEKTYIFCLVRKKYILLTPEEKVRQLMLNYLTAEFKIPLSKMAVEKSITVNGLIKRWDILVYNKNFGPELLVECKRPNLPIHQSMFDQVAIYNLAVKAPYLCITNGDNTVFAKIYFETGKFEFINDLTQIII